MYLFKNRILNKQDSFTKVGDGRLSLSIHHFPVSRILFDSREA